MHHQKKSIIECDIGKNIKKLFNEKNDLSRLIKYVPFIGEGFIEIKTKFEKTVKETIYLAKIKQYL